MKLTPQLLQAAIQMPTDVVVVGCDWDHGAQVINLYIEHEQFPVLEEGQSVTTCDPVLTSLYDVAPREIPVVSWEWNVTEYRGGTHK